jgi:hypothetical protein
MTVVQTMTDAYVAAAEAEGNTIGRDVVAVRMRAVLTAMCEPGPMEEMARSGARALGGTIWENPDRYSYEMAETAIRAALTVEP